MRRLFTALLLAIGVASVLPGFAQEPPPVPQGPRLQLTFEGEGRVTLISNGATLREILQEWTAKGGTPFVGADRLTGAGLTLQYDKQSEVDVLRSLLRSASGLILAPRREGSVGASQFEAVFVVATSNATAGSSTYGAPSYSPPSYTQPTVSTSGNPSTEVPPVGSAAAGAAGANAPPPGPQQQQQAPPASQYNQARPAGVSPVAIQIIPVSSSGTTTAPPPTPTPTPTPPPTTTGRGGGGGGGGIR